MKDYFRAAGEITYTNAHKPKESRSSHRNEGPKKHLVCCEEAFGRMASQAHLTGNQQKIVAQHQRVWQGRKVLEARLEAPGTKL